MLGNAFVKKGGSLACERIDEAIVRPKLKKGETYEEIELFRDSYRDNDYP